MSPGPRTASIAGVALMTGLVIALHGADPALAQGAPFGVPRPSTALPPPASDGILGWLIAKQSQFYRSLSSLVRAARTDGSALWALFGMSFAYGVFHAAGPGHGKAVISSYVVANEETWRRGIALSFASSLLQALVAVLVVAVAAALLGVTARAMGEAVRWIEIASYALIAAIGAWLTWTKGGALLAARAHRVPDDRGQSAHDNHAHHAHPHAHAHAHGLGGHAHGPSPQDLAGPGGWRRGVAAIVAVGLRPCSGAILVLVFALAQGLFWAGVAATFVMGLGTALTVAAIATLAVGAKGLARHIAAHRGRGALALRAIEAAGAVLVLAFGLALLTGYMVSERIVGV